MARSRPLHGDRSEIAADAIGFVETRFASVAALQDVLAGETVTILGHTLGDPRSISYLRVLLRSAALPAAPLAHRPGAP